MKLVFILVECGCWSLFIGIVVAFVNNFRLIDNNQELIDNVRDKYSFID